MAKTTRNKRAKVASKAVRIKRIAMGTLNNVTGERGEKIAYVALTDYANGSKPLMDPAFVGDKYPGLDYFVKLDQNKGFSPVAAFQVKTTRQGVNKNTASLPVTLSKSDARRLLTLPIPAYLLGVCEITRQVFVRAIPKDGSGISSISTKYKLTLSNLRALNQEIIFHCQANFPKRRESKFV